MYKFLAKKMKEENISEKNIADLLGIQIQAVSRKMNRKSDYKLQEAILIWKKYFPQIEFDTLYSDEK